MKIMKSVVFQFIVFLMLSVSVSAQKIPAFYQASSFTGTMTEATTKVKAALKAANFRVIGVYNPAKRGDLKVIVFTRSDIESTVLKVKDRGALAVAMKIGLKKKGDKIEITLFNPEFLFHAYLGKNMNTYETKLKAIAVATKNVVKSVGGTLTTFGGGEEKAKLQKYQYAWGMPYFTDPIELKTFASFEEGVTIIEKNLKARVGGTAKVYRLKYTKSKIAVYGVALNSKTTGEAHFLPIIGMKNIAAMPYEIILQGNKATMLHGRFRIALGWPTLSMGTFSKIMSTPGNVEETMKLLIK